MLPKAAQCKLFGILITVVSFGSLLFVYDSIDNCYCSDVNDIAHGALKIGKVDRLVQSHLDRTNQFGVRIQMGLNKPIHFTDFESSVRDIVNITAVAVIDAIVDKKKAAK